MSNTKTFESENSSLSFNERIQLAIKERAVIQEEYQNNKKIEAIDIINTIEKFVSDLLANDNLTKLFIKAIHNSNNNSRRKVVELFTFNAWNELGSIYNQTIPSVGIEGKRYSTKYILSGGYKKLTDKYVLEKSTTVKELLEKELKTDKYHNGKDPETGNDYHVCVFWRKTGRSTFKNGIYISRDGIAYT